MLHLAAAEQPLAPKELKHRRDTSARFAARRAAPRHDHQLLAVGRRRASEIAVLRLDRETAQFEQMAELVPVGPAQRHLARVLVQHVSGGIHLAVAPEIAADLHQVIEPRAQDLGDEAVSGQRVDRGYLGRRRARVDQQVETGVEQVQREPAIRSRWRAMAFNALRCRSTVSRC